MGEANRKVQTVNDTWNGATTNRQVIATNAFARHIIKTFIVSGDTSTRIALIDKAAAGTTTLLGPLYYPGPGGVGVDQVFIKGKRGSSIEVTGGAGSMTVFIQYYSERDLW